MMLTQILLFLPAAAIVAASPGASNLLAFANGSRRGFRPAAIALSGRCIAFVLMIAMVILGLGALLESSEIAFKIIKWAGVAYLAYLGMKMVFGPRNTEDRSRNFVCDERSYDLARREFIVSMTNPKAVLLFTAFVPQFIVASTGNPFMYQLSVLGIIYIAVECIAAMGWAFAGGIIRSAQPSARRLLLLNRITGAMMLGAAGLLATARRA